MRPDGDGRFCERCQLRVTEAATLDEDGLERLTEAAARGRACARFELEHGHPRTALGLAAGLIVVALAGCATPSAESSTPPLAEVADVSFEWDGVGGMIGGRVMDARGFVGAGALVILQSSALPAQLERVTNEQGIYVFDDLPPGSYTIQVLYGNANTTKITQLPENSRFRANFTLDPEADPRILLGVVVEDSMIDATSPASSYSSRLLDYY